MSGSKAFTRMRVNSRGDGFKDLSVNVEGENIKLAEKHGDGRFMPAYMLLGANGNAKKEMKTKTLQLTSQAQSPYSGSVMSPMLTHQKELNKLKKKRSRSPEILAQQNMQKVIKSMNRIGNEPYDFRVAQSNTKQHRSSPLSPVSPKRKSTTVIDLRRSSVLSSKLRPHFHKTYDDPVSDLIDEWKEDAEEYIKIGLDTTDEHLGGEVRGARSVSEIKDEGSNVSRIEFKSMSNERKKTLPSFAQVVASLGNGPRFTKIRRHPPPGRLPDSFSGDASFRKKPETEWRTTPESAVLQRAYSYMLENVAIRDEKNLNTAVSKEMNDNMNNLFQKNIGKGFWKDEVSSSIAEPLSISAYCNERDALLFTSKSAPGLDTETDFSAPRPISRATKYKDLVQGRNISRRASQEHNVRAPLTPVTDVWNFRFSNEAHEAAGVIVRFWARIHRHRSNKAVYLQKIVRGRIHRRFVHRFRSSRTASCIIIQALVRGKLARRVLIFLEMALSYNLDLQDLPNWEVAKIPSNIRALLARLLRNARLRRQNALNGKRITKFQSILRGHRGRQMAKHERFLQLWRARAALHIQRLFRGIKGRQFANQRRMIIRRGTTRLQSRVRGSIQRSRYAIIMRFRNKCATHIERVYRGYQGKQRFQTIRSRVNAAVQICRVARGKITRGVVSRWKAARISHEQARRQRELAVVEQAAERSLTRTIAYLKTKEGMKELREETKLARQRRSEFKRQRRGLSKHEVIQSQANETFDMFDADGSGEIDIEEFKAALSEVCVTMTHTEALVAMRGIDSDDSGSVSRDEFVAWYLAQKLNSASGGGAAGLKLKGSKTFRDFSGATDKRTAYRAILAKRSEQDQAEAAAAFRKGEKPDHWYEEFIDASSIRTRTIYSR